MLFSGKRKDAGVAGRKESVLAVFLCSTGGLVCTGWIKAVVCCSL